MNAGVVLLIWASNIAQTLSRASLIWFKSSRYCGDGNKYSSEVESGGLCDTASAALCHFSG